MVKPPFDILYIFRPPIYESKSIETVFSTVIEEVKNYLRVFKINVEPKRPLWKNIFSIRKIRTNLIHITGDVAYLCLFLPDKNIILTIHDIGHYKSLKGIKKWIYGLLWIKWPIRISNKVTVVSNYTLLELTRHFNLDKKKLIVIHNPVTIFHSNSPYIFKQDEPIILQVGTAIHKNLENIIMALETVKCRYNVIGTLTPNQTKLLKQFGIKYKNFVNLSRDQLQEQYRDCDLVTFISRYEGFGMPVIEAQAMGRPVITSMSTSLPEVAGKGASFVTNPDDPIEIRERIQQILTDDVYRSDLIQKGFENVRRFSAAFIASEYMKLYKSIS